MKSIPEYFDKEIRGDKSNTIRILPGDEIMKMGVFLQSMKENPEEYFFISIQNTETGQSFERKITDISIVDMGLKKDRYQKEVPQYANDFEKEKGTNQKYDYPQVSSFIKEAVRNERDKLVSAKLYCISFIDEF